MPLAPLPLPVSMRWLSSALCWSGVITAATCVSLTGSANAQVPAIREVEKNIQLCSRTERSTPDARISSCTALIELGAKTPRSRAIAYNNRGNAYNVKGEYDRAIADYAESIKADPNYAKAFNNRGAAYQKLGQLKLAVNDFDRSIKLD